MKELRLVLPSLALALLTASGCFLISGTFLVSIDLPDPILIDSAATIEGADIDLTDNSTYNDHKDDLKDVSDCAVLGVFSHVAGGAVDVEVWMTPDITSYTTAGALALDGTKVKLWGPFHLDASGPGSSKTIDWDEAASLFTIPGKAALVAQIKGDGQFSLYAIGATAPYSFKIEKGVFVANIEAAK